MSDHEKEIQSAYMLRKRYYKEINKEAYRKL